MKNKKLENTLETAKIIGRASVFFPYIFGRTAVILIGEELKRKWWDITGVKYAPYEDSNGFVSYIRLDKKSVRV